MDGRPRPPTGAVTVRPAADRFVTEQPGIRSWHVLSAGPHYDPANVSHGPVIGCDEHLVEPGAGFDWHPHRGVVVVSWVLAGTLRHEDEGAALDVRTMLVQSTGSGIRHRETNAADEPLRLVQTTLLIDSVRRVEISTPPVRIDDVIITLAPPRRGLAVGDSLRLERSFLFAGPDRALTITW